MKELNSILCNTLTLRMLWLMIALSSYGFLNGEYRSLWVLPWNVSSPTQIDKVIDDAAKAKQDEILVEIRYRADALYKTNRRSDSYLNYEPKSVYVDDPQFDALDYAITKAHEKNIKVQAWTTVFISTPVEPKRLASNYIYQYHSDWITYTNQGSRMSIDKDQPGYFIDPGIPDVRSYLLDVLLDIVNGYPELDGLHLDYIRYPSIKLGYHPVSVRRFQTQSIVGSINDWNEWRISQINGFLTTLYYDAKRINPNLMITAAVVANYDEAKSQYAQDWKQWLEYGIIDRVYLMAYFKKELDFTRHLNIAQAMNQDDKISIGLRAWKENGGYLNVPNKDDNNGPSYTISDVYDKILITRKYNFMGLSLFSYDGLCKDNSLDVLAELAFNPKVITSETVLAKSKEETPVIALPKINPMVSIPVDSLNILIDKANKLERITNNQIKPSISLEPNKDGYVVRIVVPTAERWKWEILDKDNRIVYQRYRYYESGENTDKWSGITDSGKYIKNGQYALNLYRIDEMSAVSIPMQIGKN